MPPASVINGFSLPRTGGGLPSFCRGGYLPTLLTCTMWCSLPRKVLVVTRHSPSSRGIRTHHHFQAVNHWGIFLVNKCALLCSDQSRSTYLATWYLLSNKRFSICGNLGGYRLGVVEGAWVIGIIDELKMCERDGKQRPLLIDTKTRFRPTPPSAPQKQNGRYGRMDLKMSVTLI